MQGLSESHRNGQKNYRLYPSEAFNIPLNKKVFTLEFIISRNTGDSIRIFCSSVDFSAHGKGSIPAEQNGLQCFSITDYTKFVSVSVHTYGIDSISFSIDERNAETVFVNP